MRCVMCHRPLTTPTALIQSRGGPLAWGPKCAKAAGLTPTAVRQRMVLFSRTKVQPNPDQLDLFKEEACEPS